MSAVTPVPYKNYSKSSKDLFKTKYAFDHTIKTINNSALKGVQVESGAQFVGNGALRGFIKGKYSAFSTQSPFKGSTVDFDLSTDANTESKLNWKFANVLGSSGLNLNLLSSSKSSDKAFKRPVVGTEIEYSQQYFNALVSAKSDLDVHRVETQLSVGSDGIYVGGSALLDVSRSVELVEKSLGAEYRAADFAAGLYTEKNLSTVTASYYQNVNRNYALGAQLKYDLSGKQERTLAIGNEYRVDADTVVKAKVELPSGDISTNVEHRLANPRLLLGLSAQFNAKQQSFHADKFGVSVTLGDY